MSLYSEKLKEKYLSEINWLIRHKKKLKRKLQKKRIIYKEMKSFLATVDSSEESFDYNDMKMLKAKKELLSEIESISLEIQRVKDTIFLFERYHLKNAYGMNLQRKNGNENVCGIRSFYSIINFKNWIIFFQIGDEEKSNHIPEMALSTMENEHFFFLEDGRKIDKKKYFFLEFGEKESRCIQVFREKIDNDLFSKIENIDIKKKEKIEKLNLEIQELYKAIEDKKMQIEEIEFDAESEKKSLYKEVKLKFLGMKK